MPILQAVGRIPSGLFVVTAGRGEKSSAALMSFVQQISMEPLYVGVSIKKGRALAESMKVGERFVINILHAGDKILLRKYAAAASVGDDVHAGVRSRTLEHGGVVLLDACAYIECTLEKIVDFGADHDLYVGCAVDGELLGEPTLKPTVHIRHDGSKY